MSLSGQSSPEKVYVIGFLSAAALAALIYVIWGPQLSSKPKRKVPKKDSCPGLLNQGNSCFLNAILQACSTSPAFRHWLEERDSAGDSLLSTRLLYILKVLNNEIDDGNYGNPYDVIDSLRAKRWIISTDEQDAHELFEVLTQSLDEDRTLAPRVVPLFDLHKLEVPVCELCRNRWGTESPMLVKDKRHTFQGLLACRLQCQNCKYTCPLKYDAFDCLSLSLPNRRTGPCDLSQLLASFIKPEVVEGVECEGCTKKFRQSNPGIELSPRKTTFTKQTFLGKVPAALCLHVQRTMWLSNGVPCKRSDHVTFPEYMCMDAYTVKGRGRVPGKGLLGGRAASTGNSADPVPSPSLLTAIATAPSLGTALPPAEPSAPLYRLNAVIEHLGDVTSGHFVTHRRSPFSTLTLIPSPNWLYTSDTLVRRTRWSKVRDCTAYMLFYERV